MTLKAAVLGHPISHSLSPLIHHYWIGQYGLDAVYEAIDVLPEDLGAVVHRLARDSYAGFNVTLPHKVAVMAYCDTIDDVAAAIGAVNTVVIKDGLLHGTNTDAFGFMANLRTQCPDWQGDKDKPALILGAGGAAQAVIYALKQAGVASIIISNRTPERAAALTSGQKDISVISWSQRNDAARIAGLVVNTTSLGMIGQQALDMTLTEAKAIVCDIVYRPLMTPLLHTAQQHGLPIVTGLGMLLHQARPAFEKWFGILPEVDDNLVRLALSAADATGAA